jgi:CheY-like chemotaxis protein
VSSAWWVADGTVASWGVTAQVPVRVLVVDDSEVFRNVMSAVVAATPGFEVVGGGSSGHEALSLVDSLGP